MWILIVILIAVVLFGMVAGYFYNRNIEKKIARGEIQEAPEVVEVDSECCGQHETCEKDSLLAAVSRQIEYTMMKSSTVLKDVHLPIMKRQR